MPALGARDNTTMHVLATRALLETTAFYIVFGVVLFTVAGDWTWPQAWVFLGESEILSGAIIVWLAAVDPALLRSRMAMRFHADQTRWDRVFMAAAFSSFILWLVLIPLDARRFRWSRVPLWAEVVGAVLIALCMILVCWVFRYNSFAAPQVRIQQDRGQHVVTGGPYRIVRHPMYADALFYFIGAPLLLGSWWGLLPVPFFMIAFGIRAVREERVLRQALQGYDDYANRVRFRLLPGVW
jgi:protein-S-isoprenylcysteine O-methyltransferase Ste14